jgi:hypothetical protein
LESKKSLFWEKGEGEGEGEGERGVELFLAKFSAMKFVGKVGLLVGLREGKGEKGKGEENGNEGAGEGQREREKEGGGGGEVTWVFLNLAYWGGTGPKNHLQIFLPRSYQFFLYSFYERGGR